MSTAPDSSPTSVLYLGPEDFGRFVEERLSGFEVLHASTAQAVDGSIGRVDAILDASMKVRFDAARLACADRLQLFVAVSTGSDHVDRNQLERMGVEFRSLRGRRDVLADVTAAAEHSWLLVLACARQLRAASESVLRGNWERSLFPGPMLRGRTLGIIGCGRIGQWMARYAASFEMRVLGHDPHIESWPSGIERTDLQELLERSHVVTVHVPLNEETEGLLGREELAHLRQGAILVNTSRGGIIDEPALVEILRSGRLAAVGLDVLQGEPEIADNPLLDYARRHTNVVITPHVAGMSPDALRIVLDSCCAEIRDLLGRQSAL